VGIVRFGTGDGEDGVSHGEDVISVECGELDLV